MLRNRLVLIFIIVTATIYVSFYGGSIAYGYFYCALLAPAIAFIYTLYVYMRFRLYQDIGQRIIVKGDFVPYFFTLANEDYITFKSIKVNFLQDKSDIYEIDDLNEYCLLPNTSKKLESKLKCKYRGEYYVGVSSVEITDFLYLFRIKYPIQSKLKITVLPRVVPLRKIESLSIKKDEKELRSLQGEEDIMDIETRKYQTGDSIKQIHWKTSAKRNELYTRKYSSLPKSCAYILMDLSPVSDDENIKIVIEDLIIECTLALANYYKEERVKCSVIYEQEGYCISPVENHTDFERFYNTCVNIYFRGKYHFSEIFRITMEKENDGLYILILHNLTEELYMELLKKAHNLISLGVIIVNDNYKELETMVYGLKQAGIYVKQMSGEDKLEEVLSL